MKKQLLFLVVLLQISLTISAQKKYACYAVGFYNQENLFDTCHDAGKNDYEFLPNGSAHWDKLRYTHKIHNMARALADIGTDILPNVGCAMIGMAEVENDNVLNDLIAQPPLKARGYRYIHIEGPDRRGIDCALLYNPALYSIKNVKLIQYHQELAKDSAFKTRGFLTISGVLADEHVSVIVCHWPSRFSGSFYRESAGRQVKVIKDSLLRDDPHCKVIVMGDMNDDPTNASMYKYLGAKGEIDQVGPDEMYNPWYNILAKDGKGTLSYKGSWDLFDQIVMAPNLLNMKGQHDYSTLKFWKNEIAIRDYLVQQSGPYKGTPKRTTAGGVWLDGYSDHFPVVAYFLKEKSN